MLCAAFHYTKKRKKKKKCKTTKWFSECSCSSYLNYSILKYPLAIKLYNQQNRLNFVGIEGKKSVSYHLHFHRRTLLTNAKINYYTKCQNLHFLPSHSKE